MGIAISKGIRKSSSYNNSQSVCLLVCLVTTKGLSFKDSIFRI